MLHVPSSSLPPKCIGLLGVDVITFGGRCNQSFRNSKDVCFPVWMNDRCHATKTA